jgi:hypothetical protein
LRLTASLLALLGLTGVWLGHALEYLRVWGSAGVGQALVGPAHVYMLPLGLVLVIAAALMARHAWSSWHRLARRCDRAALALKQARRGRRPPLERDPPIEAPPSWEARILSLGAMLAFAQVCLYLLQENLEALAAGRAAPLLGVITGVHWAAALIQLDVAFVVLAVVTLLLRRFRSRIVVVAALESLLRVLRATLRPPPAPRPLPLCAPAPDALRGSLAWSRPPPSR